MPRKLITNRHVKTYQNIMGNVVDDLGREVVFYVGSGIVTANWDEVNDEPIDPLEEITYSDRTFTVTGSVRWFKDEDIEFVEGGILTPGSVRVKCKLEDVLASGTDINGRTLFDVARKIEVDGQECELISRPVRTGLRDLFIVTAYLKRVEDAD